VKKKDPQERNGERINRMTLRDLTLYSKGEMGVGDEKFDGTKEPRFRLTPLSERGKEGRGREKKGVIYQGKL